MKYKILPTLIVAVTLSTSSNVIANSAWDTYLGIQYAIGDYSEADIPDYSPTALVGRFGGFIHPNFAFEGRFGTGMKDDTQNVFGFDATLELDTLVGLYGVGHLNITKASSIYGLIGFSGVDGTVTVAGFPDSESDSETDLSYGVGANIGVTKKVALNAEYISYISKDFDLNAIGLGLVIGF
jgi:outer membrane immunogenic protein